MKKTKKKKLARALLTRRAQLKIKWRWKIRRAHSTFTSSMFRANLRLRRRLGKIFGKDVQPWNEIERLQTKLFCGGVKLKLVNQEEVKDAKKLLAALEAISENCSKNITCGNRFLKTFSEFEGVSAELDLQVSKSMQKTKSTVEKELAGDTEDITKIGKIIPLLNALIMRQN